MAGSAGPQRGGIIEGINVTPLVDIMLVLLVIFIVTAKILVSPAVPLDLPKATRSEEIQVIFAVSLAAAGPIRVNGQPVSDLPEAQELPDLRRQAAAALARDAELRAVIQADGTVPHQRVMSALDALRQAGLTRVAFATQPPTVSPAAPAAP